mgnify:CR=1 FL=1
MANGIQDLTSIMMEGGRGDVPPQPMMGGGLGAMMPQQAAPMPSPDMGGMPPDMGGMPPNMGGMSPDMMMAEQMPMEEEPMSIEQDAGALAEAVVGRAQGDIGAAVAILDTAKAMLVQSTQQDPMMEQDPMMMAQGGPMYAMGGKYMDPEKAMGGKYMYAASGRPLTSEGLEEQNLEQQSDTLRQMIMNGLDMFDVTRGQGMILNEGDLMGMGRTMSDSERGRTMSDANLEQLTKLLAQANAQQGRTISDKDLEFHKQMLMDSMTEADKDLRLDMGLDAQYYNELEDERKRAAERAKLYRSR